MSAVRFVCTYFPLWTGSMPKFEPTIPVHEQVSSAAFVHLAVAVAPTFRHAIDADDGETARSARTMVRMIVIFAGELGSADYARKRSRRRGFKYPIHDQPEFCLRDGAPIPRPIEYSGLGVSCYMGHELADPQTPI